MQSADHVIELPEVDPLRRSYVRLLVDACAAIDRGKNNRWRLRTVAKLDPRQFDRHINKLVNAGLVTVVKRGREPGLFKWNGTATRYYFLTDKGRRWLSLQSQALQLLDL